MTLKISFTRLSNVCIANRFAHNNRAFVSRGISIGKLNPIKMLFTKQTAHVRKIAIRAIRTKPPSLRYITNSLQKAPITIHSVEVTFNNPIRIRLAIWLTK